MTYAERDGDSAVIRWPITQPELATLAGASEPSVQKALDQVAKDVQKLERVGFESDTAEAYHAVKHQGEVPPRDDATGDLVSNYDAAAQDTIRIRPASLRGRSAS